MRTINIEYDGYDFQASYTFSEGDKGDYFNAPEGPEINITSLVLVDDDFVICDKEEVGDTINFPPEEYIKEQILELKIK